MIYLDNAATTYPKPQCVTDAVLNFMKNTGGNPGRGGHRLSNAALDIVTECREELSSLIASNYPERIIFTKNTTEALNLAIKGIIKPQDEIIITSMEHNSVLRSCIAMEKDGVRIKIARADSNGYIDVNKIEELITERTRLICTIHASNVVGTVNPVREIHRMAKKRGVFTLVDAAQTAGVLNIDTDCADMIAFAGHKGLYGPTGTGALYISPGIKLKTLMEGGTGSLSESALMPDILPDRYEAGTLNACGIAGLCEGIKFIKREGVIQKEEELNEHMIKQLSSIKGARLLGNPGVNVAGIFLKEHDCVEISSRLDNEFSIATRAGLHCSPMAHRTLGTVTSGLLRISAGFFNTKSDIDSAAFALQKVIQN